MMTGRQALATMEQAIAKVRTDESNLDVALQSAEADSARLRQERMQAFRALAQVKLDLMARDQFVGELDAAERRAFALIEQHRQALGASAAKRNAAAAKVEEAQTERHARAEAFEVALAAYEAKKAEVQPVAEASPEWKAQRQAFDHAVTVIEEADKKATVAEQDRDDKRKPYEADRLFMYLWNRKFGTAEYRAGNFVRFFDRKVADLVGYLAARPNYTMLLEIPLRLRTHADRVKEGVEAERQKLIAIETDALHSAGGAPLERAAADAQAGLERAEARLAEVKSALEAADRDHQALTSKSDSDNYREAINVLAEADSRLDLASLHRDAMRTVTREDEAIVMQIAEIDGRLEAIDRQIAEIRHNAMQLATRRAEIERVRDDSRRRGYDNPNGQFDNGSMIGSVLGGILSGALQGAILEGILRDNFRDRSGHHSGSGGFNMPFPPSTNSGSGWFGGSGSSSSGGSWSGSGDSGGSSGGDFTSGDSF